MKICLLGTGIYGLAIAMELAKKCDNIWMWSENSSLVRNFKKTHELKEIYDIKIPKSIHLTNSYEEAVKNADVIFITCASKYVDAVCQAIKPYFKRTMHICIATKGIEESTEKLLSNVVGDTLLTRNIAVISGPTFAIDMLNGKPVALAIASLKPKTAHIITEILANDKLKLRISKDIIGIQLCGSVKNCIAIASGILNGLGYPESTQAFLINESLHDIKNIIYFLGGKPKTILSFAGVGDLMLTCTSQKSRNFKFGYTIGKTKDKQKIDQFLMKNTVEGYYTVEVIYKLLKHKNIDIPLINIIYDIIYNNVDPENLANFLISKK